MASYIKISGPIVNDSRLPEHLRQRLRRPNAVTVSHNSLRVDRIYTGDAQLLLPRIAPESVALSVWSPPYYVGKEYESHLTFETWQELLRKVIALHYQVMRPGGFVVINIADILCFRDPDMPRIQFENPSKRKSPVTTADVLRVMRENPGADRYEIARVLGCSEQTVDRRLNGNNIRGGKYSNQTRVKVVSGLIEEWALSAGFYIYDRRVWIKDAAWANSRWSTLSFRSVDEFEYLFFLWKPGITQVKRERLTSEEWTEWGARGVWNFPSVRANDEHEAMFPIELPRRVVKLLTDPGDVVLDCFMGSGTTGVAAALENRHYIGIELVPEYSRHARLRIAYAIKKGFDAN